MSPACGYAQAGAFSGRVYPAEARHEKAFALRFSCLMASPAQLDTLPNLYHQSIRSQDVAKAEHLVRLAFQTSAYTGEAHLWRSLPLLQSQQHAVAFLHIAKALEHQPSQAPLYALLVQCLQQQGLLTQACSVLDAALVLFPTDRTLRCAQAPLLHALYGAGLLSKSALQLRLQQALPDIADPRELRLTLDALHTHVLQTEAGSETQSLVGVVWHNPVQQQIGGWVIDLNQHARLLEVEVEFLHQGQPIRTRFPASAANPLLQVAYGISHGSFRAQLPLAIDTLTVRCADGPSLIGSPLAALPVFTPPSKEVRTGKSKQASKKTIDILVPVYKGRQATLDCVDSVIHNASRNRSRYNLIVLDDASPDQELVAALQKRARQGKLRYLRHPANLGFIRNMNRGMALHPEHDVVWLNADTRVHGDWLDRLRSAAYSADNIASVTPFSNNGELMSFPRMRHAAPMPDAQAHAALDDTARRLDLDPVPLEAGCGFCMYIKRQALDEVGYLDEVQLKRGYGEETDWCLRAQAHGWRHVGAVNVFVAHAGGHSFGPEKALRAHQNNAVLRQRYPHADRNFQRYVTTDPLAPARNKLTAALQQTGSRPQAQKHPNTQIALDWLEHAEADAPHFMSKPSSTALERVKTVGAKKATSAAGSTPVATTQAPPTSLQHQNQNQSHSDASFLLQAPLWLIADSLDQHAPATVAQRWLQLARHLARLRRTQQSTPLLLLAEESPWAVQLLATGQVVKLPRAPGLSQQDFLEACGNPAELHLAGDTAPSWFAALFALNVLSAPSAFPAVAS